MAYQVLVHPLAEKEFIDAFLWYEERLPGLGLRFQGEIDIHLNLISKTPLSFPKTKRNFREIKVHTFPYLIVYKILVKRKIILISAFHHTSRNPKTKNRK
jgi:mRNA-degrading endonuclease RelE of RelBE toxin-antitoxin system